MRAPFCTRRWDDDVILRSMGIGTPRDIEMRVSEHSCIDDETDA